MPAEFKALFWVQQSSLCSGQVVGLLCVAAWTSIFSTHVVCQLTHPSVSMIVSVQPSHCMNLPRPDHCGACIELLGCGLHSKPWESTGRPQAFGMFADPFFLPL